MAVGFTLCYNKNGWKTISNPVFVFTSPNMDDQSSAGTRSHIVAGECDVGTWLEDTSLNKMWKMAYNQDESLTWETVVNEYSYDDYRPYRIRISEAVSSPFSKIYLAERPIINVYSNLDDNFTGSNGNYPNTDNWYVSESLNGSVNIQNNKLHYEVSSSAAGSEYTAVVSNYKLTGDFDIQCDFSNIIGGNELNGTGIQLYFYIDSYNYMFVKAHFNTPIQFYSRVVTGGSSSTAYDTRVNSYGKLRLIRVDDTVTTYYLDGGGSWEISQTIAGFSTNDGDIRLGQYVPASSGDTSVDVDNFKVNVGTPMNFWYPNPTVSINKFEATKITPAVANWWKLNETGEGPYSDSIGSFGLVSSGGVVPIYYPPLEFYAPEFDGDSDSLIYSYSDFELDDSFCFSFYVDSYGPTASGTDSFGYASTFINVVSSGTYFSIGCSETNTITYSIKTNVSTYKSNTGSTLASGTFLRITGSYNQGDGFYLYKDDSLLAHNSMVSGTVGVGNLCIGNTAFGYISNFNGTVSDVKYWDSYLDSDMTNEVFLIDQLDEYPICMFGSSAGEYVIDVSPNPVEMDKGLFYGTPMDKEDSHFSDTLHLFMKFGEAYNCYITAWDDATHSSILNTVLSEELCKVAACVYRSPDANVDTWPDDNQQDTTIAHTHDYVSDFPIKGNELFYGKFNLVYYIREPNIIGDIVSVRPRISTITSDIFDPGNYDFVITFHYQYT